MTEITFSDKEAKMMYSGIDLHSNNSVVAVIDDADRVVARKRLPNDITKIVGFLARWKDELAGVVVESTYNWYWLVDGTTVTVHSIGRGGWGVTPRLGPPCG